MKKSGIFLTGFLTCMLLMSSILTALAAGDVEIKALLANTIKMKLNGADFKPQESSGTYLKPILYNGRTYLPVRSLAEALSIPVDWDGTTRTVWIGGKTENVPVNNTTLYKNEYGTIITTDTAALTTTETAYEWGIVNPKPLQLAYYECYLFPNGEYKNFKASVFMDAEVKRDMVMEFRKDNSQGEVIKTVTIKPGETVDVNFGIGGVKKIFIFAKVLIGHDEVKKLIIGEPTFSNSAERVQ